MNPADLLSRVVAHRATGRPCTIHAVGPGYALVRWPSGHSEWVDLEHLVIEVRNDSTQPELFETRSQE